MAQRGDAFFATLTLENNPDLCSAKKCRRVARQKCRIRSSAGCFPGSVFFRLIFAP
jgi:hypothetical protein